MERTSQIAYIDGPVHYIDHGGSGPAIVMAHGLGGSHLNWELIGPALSAEYHPYAVDMRGFGLTPLDGQSVSLSAQAELLARFIQEVAGGRAILVGNSMGGLISMLLAARYPELVERLVLIGPALPMRSTRNVNRATLTRLGLPVVPWIGEGAVRRFATLGTPEERTDLTWSIVTARPNRIDAATRANAVEMTRLRDTMEWAPDAYCGAIRSITATLGRRRRFRDMIHRISAPTLLIHGMLDEIVHFEGAEWLAQERPDWRFAPIPDAGHVPQLELPARTLKIFRDWVDSAVPAT